ncbi:histidine phosphatase family protein [Marinobacterium stanieri]|uniref:histidine phosphatase family protein n=1 Tax=Marinobacterium stanieri TaxID=49186 RepID=UPI003A921CAB
MIDTELALVRRPFVFMRHGETPANAGHLICGSTDVPLSPRGEEQARSAAWLGGYSWSCVATSQLQRARSTAQLALPERTLISVEDLQERHWGALEMAPLTEQTPYEETPPDGEPWIVFKYRVVHALNQLLNAYDLPLIVAHSGVYRVIRELQTGTPQGPRIENAEPVLIEPQADGWDMTLLKEIWFEQR